jgi:predicted DNA-binding transcriptional regulator YafY
MAIMRADRLVALLMLLQTRGHVTAAEVALELEVSERTARRDLEALGMAGLPIYSQQGRNGGWQLLGGARTDLSGLTAPEARALFLVAGPSSAATPQVRAALRKLVRALPEPFRPAAEAASNAVVVDQAWWGHTVPERTDPPHLEELQRAVVEGEQVRLGYVARDRATSTRVVHPLGLAAKGHVWYLVADTDAGLRTFRIDRVTAVEATGDAVQRPEGFDLNEAWRMVSEEVDQRSVRLWARGLARPICVPWLRGIFGNRLRVGPSRADGRVEVDVGGLEVGRLARDLAQFGNFLEIVDPPEVRRYLAELGRDLTELYG